MKYVSYAERSGFEKGIEKGEVRGAKKSLRRVMKARFGDEGAALVDSLGEESALSRLEDLAAEAAVKNDLSDLRPLFLPVNGNGSSPAT